jgi:hypothetical protein
MAYGDILKHLEVDKITWSFSLKNQKMTKLFSLKKNVSCLNWCGEHCCG